MAEKIRPGVVAGLLAGKSESSSEDGKEGHVVQVLEIKQSGSFGSVQRYMAQVNDGVTSVRAMLPSTLSSEISSKKLEDTGLIRIKDFTVNEVNGAKVVMVISCEVVLQSLGKKFEKVVSGSNNISVGNGSSSLSEDSSRSRVGGGGGGGGEDHAEKKRRLSETTSEPRSASKIAMDQSRGSTTPRTGAGRRVYPVDSLNPYQGHWTIKVQVTSKEAMRTYRNARGSGNLFSVLFADEEGTQIQATMFNEAAEKFFPILQVGKVYYVSKGSLRASDKRYRSVNNDYEMTLNVSSVVEEVGEEEGGKMLKGVRTMKYKFVKIDGLGAYVGSRELVDVVGIVQSVSEVMGIRRKADNEELSKREVTLVDQSCKTVVVTLWGALATEVGKDLQERAAAAADAADAPVLAVKALRVGGFQGVSLSTVNHSNLQIDPEGVDLEEARALRDWWRDGGGKDMPKTSAGAGLIASGTGRGGMSNERSNLANITRENVGMEKSEFFDVRACLSLIKPDQNMWYNACPSCNRKVTGDGGSSGKYWCEQCQKSYSSPSKRYVLVASAVDSYAEAKVLQVFNDQAEQMIGMSADQLAELREESEGSADASKTKYARTLIAACWKPMIMTISVAYSDYNDTKRQRLVLRRIAPVNYVDECRLMLAEINKHLSGH